MVGHLGAQVEAWAVEGAASGMQRAADTCVGALGMRTTRARERAAWCGRLAGGTTSRGRGGAQSAARRAAARAAAHPIFSSRPLYYRAAISAGVRQVRARRHARLTAMERRRRPSEPMAKAVRRRDKPRERWLLTRKTWKYMSDAGRRLVPDGAQNRLEDLPRIEACFQEVCAREPRFLLWRKSSYPSALPRPRRKKRARGGSVRARSPPDDAPPRPTELLIGHTSGGRFDLAKLRRDFFAAPPPPPAASAFSPSGKAATDDDESVLVDLLRKYLKVEDEKAAPKLSEAEELVLAIRKYLTRQAARGPADADADPTRRSLLDTLGKYYTRTPTGDNAVQDLLTDKNLLKRLYQDLRKTKPYRGGRSGGIGGAGGFGPSGFGPGSFTGLASARSTLRSRIAGGARIYDGEDGLRSPPMSPPPLIEVISESLEDKYCDRATQTPPIPEEVLCELEAAYRERLEAATAPTSPTSPPPERKPARRRSSVDHDDVSQSVSDTIKRYLRMARKKSVDSEKVDRFKRINYDKNLRNIKPRVPGEVDDDGPHKGCQTEERWVLTYRELQFDSAASTPTSPPSPTQSPSLLSSLLGRGVTSNVPAGGMQKSRSSGSVVQSVSKRLWRPRSRSSSRAAAAWAPQYACLTVSGNRVHVLDQFSNRECERFGSCCWTDGSGRCVRLADTSLLALSEVERRALQQAALARLQQINLGTTIKIPEENSSAAVATKPKRRAYLLKRKALTTGFFDQSRAKDGDKDKESPGSVFGVPLAQCVEMERALRRQQHGGSRASLASLGALDKGDDSESCDSGEWWAGLEESGGPRVPGLVTACLAHLRRHGLRTLGLFRVSASKKRVRQLREDWERAQEAALDSAVCPHDVATLLKEFLRDLPDPLLCRDLYPAF
ncbi:Rho GTPase-activating protein 6 [Papilio xuthus]|uniref:Rho GTPase-activating protein 6 n=1 Tax=Papilio xuthus TaxID=66420 RepID=A0A194Q761_PAPXU|nr:Rho GTPase-activating protein 6 [Papilio xuthus]